MVGRMKESASNDLNFEEKGVWGRQKFYDLVGLNIGEHDFLKNNSDIQIDDRNIVWIFHKKLEIWISIFGRYSNYSPYEKYKKETAYDYEIRDLTEKARQMFLENEFWSMVRQEVLIRDDFTCQLCGKMGTTKLHVHHILKKRDGGRSHYDQLITTCPSCHSKADRSLYNPDWEDVG